MFFIILLIAFVFLVSCSIMGYYSLWKRKNLNKAIFFLMLILLIANMFFAVKKSMIIPFLWLRHVCYFIAVLTFITLIYSAFLFIPKWIFEKTAKHFHKSGKFAGFVSSAKSTFVIFLIMIILSAAGYINMGTYRQTDYTINIDKACDVETLDCAVISDTHIGIGAYSRSLDKLVDKINSINADVIFLVGDIVDESTTNEDIDRMISAFSRLKCKKGVYYVSGNHEGYADFDCKKYMGQAGITVLEDETVNINGVNITGRKDSYAQRKELKDIVSSQNVNLTQPLIVLNHEPLQLQKMADEGADLTICGHTHGEQFPFTKALFSLANDMMYGTEKFGSMTAVTTSGAAGWGFHFKLPAASEIVHLKINFSQ